MARIRTKILDITQAQLAELTNTSQATVSRWERGELEPSRDQLALIRNEARRRNLPWSDEFFFFAPEKERAA